MKRLLWGFALWMMTGGVSVNGQSPPQLDSLYHWEDTSLVSSSFYDNTYNEIWGVTRNGREYAIIGSTVGTHFFDVTDPRDVDTVDFVPGAAQGDQIVHRDYHDYNGYLYMVSDEGTSTLQIADLSYLPDSVPLVYDTDSQLIQAHNIFIDTATAKLYAASALDSTGTGQNMQIYSLDSPTDPELLANFSKVGNVHDLYVRNDTGYCNIGFNGLYVYDFAQPDTPTLLGSLTTYPDQHYNHSGWLSPDGETYVFTDENQGMDVKICDVSDLSNITVIDTIDSGISSQSMAHNPLIRDSFLYISYYHDGTYVFNIADPADAKIAGYYDTYPPAGHSSYKGNWGVYPFLPSGRILASDMQSGLFVFDSVQAASMPATNPSKPSSSRLKVSVSPNPVIDRLTLTINTPQSLEGQVALQSLSGRVVWGQRVEVAQGVHRQQYQLPARISAGFYLLTVRTYEKQVVKKLVKTH